MLISFEFRRYSRKCLRVNVFGKYNFLFHRADTNTYGNLLKKKKNTNMNLMKVIEI